MATHLSLLVMAILSWAVCTAPCAAQDDPELPARGMIHFRTQDPSWALTAEMEGAHGQSFICRGDCTAEIVPGHHRFNLLTGRSDVRVFDLERTIAPGVQYLARATFEREESMPDTTGLTYALLGCGLLAVGAAIGGGFLVTSAATEEVVGGGLLFGLSAVFVAIAIWLLVDIQRPRVQESFDLRIDRVEGQ